MKQNLFVTFADSTRIQYARQLFSSVYWNAGWRDDMMLLTTSDVTDDQVHWYTEKGILVKKCATPVWFGGLTGYPLTMYNIFYLFTPEFKRWQTVLYLDTNSIVRSSLERLTNVAGFAAAPDIFNASLKYQFDPQHLRRSPRSLSYYTGIRPEEQKNAYQRLTWQYKLRNASFSVGTMAFNTNIITDDSLEILRLIYKQFSKISGFALQAELNLFFYRKWQRLPYAFGTFPVPWNDVLNYSVKNDPAAIVLYFPGAEKPWERNSPFYSEWLENDKRGADIDLSRGHPPLMTTVTDVAINALEKKIKRKYDAFGVNGYRRMAVARLGKVFLHS